MFGINVWAWFKPVKPRVLEVPADKVRLIRCLRDDLGRVKADEHHEAKYALWKKVAEVLPEVEHGSWELDFSNALTVMVREIL